MHRLYAELGNYAAVGRKIGRSGSTVAKYINMKGTPDIVKHTFKEIVRGVTNNLNNNILRRQKP